MTPKTRDRIHELANLAANPRWHRSARRNAMAEIRTLVNKSLSRMPCGHDQGERYFAQHTERCRVCDGQDGTADASAARQAGTPSGDEAT